MHNIKPWMVTLMVLSSSALSGCSKSDSSANLPELNAANCAPEKIVEIKNESARRDFASKCLRLGTLSPSQKKDW